MFASTASEWLFSTVRSVARHFTSMPPAELAVDVGLTAVIAAVTTALVLLVKRLARKSVSEVAEPSLVQRLRRSRAFELAVAALRLAIGLGGAWMILEVWGVDVNGWVGGAGGQAAMRVAGRVVLLLVIAIAAFEAAGFAIDRTMGRLFGGARDARRAAQLRTLAPLLKALLRTTIVVMAAMMLLSEFDVKIGPLLAGAGVVGIAIGFGAQTLVKDFLTGLFLIVEDIVSVGDTVQIGSSSGAVEAMTLRTIRLRDFDGTLHVFPYSEAQVIHNATKAFSYAVIDLQVGFRTDLDAALDAMRRAGEALAADAAFSSKILAPIEVLGVEKLAENGVQLRARIKTRAGDDSVVQRELYRRIKSAFDEAGVNLANPNLRLVMPPVEAPDNAQRS